MINIIDIKHYIIRILSKELRGLVVTARALLSLLAMRSLALRIDPLRISNLASTKIRVLKGFSSLLLSSLFIFKLSFITSL
jgi:hypothetical protein